MRNDYMILTGSAIESNRLQQTRWIPSANLAPATLLGGRGVHLAAPGWDLFYTDAALDVLVRSANLEGREWAAWREARHMFKSVRPLEAWEFLHETSREELLERDRMGLEFITITSTLDAAAPTLSHLDLVNFERRHCAAALKAKAADHLIRVAPRRIIVTEEQTLNRVTVRATWAALNAADRAVPGWLLDGLDTTSMAGVE